jgi:uncharacterized membrane protein
VWPEHASAASGDRTRERLALVTVIALAAIWAATFGWLALQRHFAGGTHAEDLGFTDQVLWNFLPPRWQWFRMSIYAGAAQWNTELDIAQLARPDSLMAFHFEPLLLALIPFHVVGGMPLLLALQSAALAAGALPAYRLAHHWTCRASAGIAVSAAYLLSPLGQWTTLADFHTTALAAPLLLLCIERLVVARRSAQALVAAALAALAREDIGLTVAALGVAILIARRPMLARAALGMVAIGLACSALGLLVIHHYSGGSVSPFAVRYGPSLSIVGALGMLARPLVGGYAVTLLASGAWLGLLAPLALLPVVPSLALNVLSTSTWMASGQAHYSAIVLPCVTLAAAAGLRQVAVAKPTLIPVATLALALTSTLAYVSAGAGPLGSNYAPAVVTDHARRAAALAATLPADAAVSASTALVPRVSQRSRAYVFPAVLDADYVFVDLESTPAPTSAGDVYRRIHDLLAEGGWQVDANDDGLLLLERNPDVAPTSAALQPPSPTGRFSVAAAPNSVLSSSAEYGDGPALLDAQLVPSPDGASDVDGPHWILRTFWQTDKPLAPGTRLAFNLRLRDGQTRQAWDAADLWWNPPDTWPLDQIVRIDVPDVPKRTFQTFEPVLSRPKP